MSQQSSMIAVDSPEKMVTRLCIVVVFGIAFAYIESAVVIYLRAIFYPDGFVFPLAGFGQGQLWERLLLVEVGREAATLVLIITAAFLFGRNRRQRFAYFLVIFAIWDIFYYLWLKVFLDWPSTILDWDILFLIPLPWASPVLAPVVVSLTMLCFALVILQRDALARAIRVGWIDWLGFGLTIIAVITSFCIGGLHAGKADFREYFYWPLFGAGLISAIGLFINCLVKSKSNLKVDGE